MSLFCSTEKQPQAAAPNCSPSQSKGVIWCCFIIQKQSVGYINHPVGYLSGVFGWDAINYSKPCDMWLSH